MVSPRPQGDWPTILGTVVGALGFLLAGYAYLRPPRSEAPAAVPSTSAVVPATATTGSSSAAEASTSTFVVVLAACSFVILIFAALYLLSRVEHRLLTTFAIVLAATFYEALFWNALNLWACLLTIGVFGLLVAFSGQLSEYLIDKRLLGWSTSSTRLWHMRGRWWI